MENIDVLIDFLRKKNIKINFKLLQQTIKNNSYSNTNSLQNIIDALHKFGIKNDIYKIKYSDLLEEQSIEDLLIIDIDVENEFTFFTLSETDKKKKLSEDDIYILYIDFENFKGDYTYSTIFNLKNGLYFFFIITLIFFYFSKLNFNIDYKSLVFIFLSSIGCYISYITLKLEYGLSANQPKLCSISKKTSCKRVFSDKKWKLFSIISLSDASSIFFLSQLIIHIIFYNKEEFIKVAFLYNHIFIIIIIFTFLSIFYQWKIIKKWCPLCLSIIILLYIEFCVYRIITYNHSITVDTYTIIKVLYIYTVTQLIYLIFKELVISLNKNKLFYNEIKNYKSDVDIFNLTLSRLPYKVLKDRKHPILLGDKNSENNLIFITNPECPTCKKYHNDIHNIINNLQDNLKIEYIFCVDMSNESEVLTSAKLMYVYENLNDKFSYLIDDVYKEGNDINNIQIPEEYINGYLESLSSATIDLVKKDISFTPSFLYNNKLIPLSYSPKEIHFILNKILN